MHYIVMRIYLYIFFLQDIAFAGVIKQKVSVSPSRGLITETSGVVGEMCQIRWPS